MKNSFLVFFILGGWLLIAQKPSLVILQKDGSYKLSEYGASYFANLSLKCLERQEPNYLDRVFESRYKWKLIDTTSKKNDYWPSLRGHALEPDPKDLWPSFFGCYDWHSSVHNTWCLIKLLKSFPNLPEAKEIRERLNYTFKAENIQKELDFVYKNENGLFEFPYGQSWLLKVAEELGAWSDPDAQIWLENLIPLAGYIEDVHIWFWRNQRPSPLISGSHDSPSLGLSFARDFAITFNREVLLHVIDSISKKYYLKNGYYNLSKEPVEYDFMSGGLLVTDLMRKVLEPREFKRWLNDFAPELLNTSMAPTILYIKRTNKHDEYESHWDGYHLNRIWCLNGVLSSLDSTHLDPQIKKIWVKNMNEMWDYSQESIGKGNYDIDHWLSSFSVFALMGYSRE